MTRRAFLALLLLIAAALPARAIQPGEELADPALEARARALSREIRCLVCQNQSIDESEADLARDLRMILRERIKAGDSDAEVKAFMVARYGDYVLLDPPFKAGTLLLWLGPALMLLLGLGAAARYLRRPQRRAAEAPPLSADERRRLDELLTEMRSRDGP
jgi:cytochrome c-type biogenesis protein CcmH